MRDIAVFSIAVVAALMALRRPYYGALLWVWVSLMNPHRLGWGFAYDLPLAQVAVVVTLLGMLFHSNEVRWPGGAALYALIVFTLWMGLTTLTAILVEPSLSIYQNLLKVVFMTIIIATVVRTREEILGLIWVIVVSIGFFGIKGGVFSLRGGGVERVWGPPSSIIEGNNELAIALVMVIPLLYFLVAEQRVAFQSHAFSWISSKWQKRGLYAAIALCGLSALGSQSRGALLAIGAMTVVLWWRSDRKLPLMAFLLVLIPAVLLFMPDSWFDRMQTIETYGEDRSAMGRINAWTMAFNIAKDRVMGAGLATASPFIYAQYAPDPSYVLVAHSIYFQVLGEHGFIGLGLYLVMWVITYRMAGRIVRVGTRRADLRWAASFGSMAKVSLVGFAVGGAFLSLAYWDMPLYLMVVLVVLQRWLQEVVAQSRTEMTSEATGRQLVMSAGVKADSVIQSGNP